MSHVAYRFSQIQLLTFIMLFHNDGANKTFYWLIVQGEPVWGLSSAERDLIRLAREKMNNC